MPVLPGKLIVIEGLEGAGKSSAINTVIDVLSSFNIKTMTTREPGGTPIGEQLREIIKNPTYKDELDDKTELLLLYASRIQLIKECIYPALTDGVWVIADRFELSTLAYQGGGRGLDHSMLQALSAFCLDGFKPDLTLYLDLSPEQGMQRVRQRGAVDRIEQQSMAFFHRVHAAYLKYLDEHPEIIKVDASLPLDAVQETIKKAVHHFIEQALNE